jgi:hypothetical protein
MSAEETRVSRPKISCRALTVHVEIGPLLCPEHSRCMAKVGHHIMTDFLKSIGTSPPEDDLKAAVESGSGASGLMECARFDLGEVLRKTIRLHPQPPRFLTAYPKNLRHCESPLLRCLGSWAVEKRNGVSFYRA